ncbi:MAG: hypothetical protein ABL973_02310 [Micropepsaceae bacterium]
MAQQEHKLMSTPVSVNDGLKRSDQRTWAILGGCVVFAGVVVLAINLFVPKQKIRWPSSPSAPQAATGNAGDTGDTDEPRTYDVAPPRRPQKSN